jgi:hypothetical protein
MKRERRFHEEKKLGQATPLEQYTRNQNMLIIGV